MKEKSSYRILMFAPAFAPFANAEAIVNNKLALVMLEAGWKVDIISRDFVGASPYDYGSGWVEPWLPLREHTHEISYKLGGKLLRTLDIMRCVAKTFYPFDGCRWAARAYDRTISLLKKKRYDVILSRAFPEYAHLPAMKISQDTGILWIANWNDPWRFLRQRVITGSLKDNLGFFSSFFIKKIARSASWITFPTDKIRESMTEYLGKRAANRSSTIPYTTLPFLHLTKEKVLNEFRVGYFGCLSKSQNPTTFFNGFASFIRNLPQNQKVTFVFAGIEDVGVLEIAKKFGIQEHLVLEGKLSYYETLKRAAECDVLLVIDLIDVGILLTSKFVDYMQVGRPILAITKTGSTLYHYLNQHGGGIAVDFGSPELVSQVLKRFFNHWKMGDLDKEYGSDRLRPFFAPDTVLSAYSEIIERYKSES